jgi:hypothetical protein
MLGDVVLATAGRFGYPRITVALPGRSSSLVVEPYPDQWLTAVRLVRDDLAALHLMFAGLVAADLELRRAVARERSDV